MFLKFLTQDYPLTKHIFLVPRFALRIIGFDPESKQTFLLHLWALTNFGILAYGCVAELYYGVYYLKIDVVVALDALCPVASSIMSQVKIFYIWWYRKELHELMQKIRQLTELQQSVGKVQVKKVYFTWATRLSATLLLFGFCTSTSYSIRSISLNLIRYLNGQPIVYETPFKMIFPEPLLSMPIYPLTFAFSHWHGYITVVSFVGADGFFVSFCFYFTTLLKSLQEDLRVTLRDRERKLDQQDEEEVCKELEDIINRHNEIIDLIEKFSNVMVEITLGHFVSSSIIIGTSVVDLLLFSGYGIMVYVVYTCAVLTEIFVYCLGGNAVIDSSGDVAMTAYCTKWYIYSPKVQKMVWLIIVRSQRNLVIKVPFFAPSLPALTSILRFTGSLIALAKSVI